MYNVKWLKISVNFFLEVRLITSIFLLSDIVRPSVTDTNRTKNSSEIHSTYIDNSFNILFILY